MRKPHVKQTFRIAPDRFRLLDERAPGRRIPRTAVLEGALASVLSPNNVPLPDDAVKAAQASGTNRWRGFVETLRRRMEGGPKLGDELSREAG